jgi:hypothetical protein
MHPATRYVVSMMELAVTNTAFFWSSGTCESGLPLASHFCAMNPDAMPLKGRTAMYTVTQERHNTQKTRGNLRAAKMSISSFGGSSMPGAAPSAPPASSPSPSSSTAVRPQHRAAQNRVQKT